MNNIKPIDVTHLIHFEPFGEVRLEKQVRQLEQNFYDLAMLTTELLEMDDKFDLAKVYIEKLEKLTGSTYEQLKEMPTTYEQLKPKGE
jgi:hypothetical protein